MTIDTTLHKLRGAREHIMKARVELDGLLALLDGAITTVVTKEARLLTLEERLIELAKKGSATTVQLDIRGKAFLVKREDLLRTKNSFFHSMLESEWQPDLDGAYFIDCNSEGFEQVVETLHGEPLNLSEHDCESVLDALEYLQLSAHGTAFYDTGLFYTGEFVNGLRDGDGVCHYPDGDVYEGQWKNNKREGHGKHTFEGSNARLYIGEWKNDIREGHGTAIWPNGAVSMGEYKYNKREGRGTYTNEDGDVYVGEFKHGLFNGEGKLTLLNGESFTGQWKDSYLHGRVMKTYADGKVSDCIYASDRCLKEFF